MVKAVDVTPAVKPIKKEEPKEAKNDKFNQLKFGDNYDVE